MPYYTPLPDATIDLSVTTPVISLGDTLLLNELYSSSAFDQYDVDSGSGTTLNRGDDVGLVDGSGNPLLENATYAGSATLSTLELQVVPSGGGLITVQINPISGHLIVGEDGTVYMVTDEPLDAAHIGVTAEVLGVPFTDISLSDFLANPFVQSFADEIQAGLDTLAVNVDYDPNGTLVLGDDEVLPCFVLGTLIETGAGPVAVEDLKTGDLVVTRDHGLQAIRWIGAARVDATRLARRPDLRPIRIRAGALGGGMPTSDLLVSPQHRVLVRSKIAQRMFGTDEVLVAAKQLLQLDGFDIAGDLAGVTYYHILFDRHEIVISNGAATESLYTGPQALKAVGPAARAEIFALFPLLRDMTGMPPAARQLSSGRMARKLAVRHLQNAKPLYH